jgi:hypothetical protein
MERLVRSAKNRFVGAVAVTGLLLVPLGIFGGSALALSGHSGAAQYQYKVTICHHTGSTKHPWHLITISNRAVPAHLRHHDQMPPCPTTATVAHNHGKPSNDNSHSQSSSTSSGTQSHENNASSHGSSKDNNGHHGKP